MGDRVAHVSFSNVPAHIAMSCFVGVFSLERCFSNGSEFSIIIERQSWKLSAGKHNSISKNQADVIPKISSETV